MYWVVVADEYQSIFYAREKKHSSLQKFLTLKNETARQKVGDILADSGGRSFDSHGQGRHTMTNEKDDPKSHISVAFAKKVAQRLQKGRHGNEFERLIIIAAPHFLGVLRAAMETAGVQAEHSIDKDLTALDADAIQEVLDEAF